MTVRSAEADRISLPRHLFRPYRGAAGGLFTAPVGVPHGFGNASSNEPAQLLITVTPQRYIGYFREPAQVRYRPRPDGLSVWNLWAIDSQPRTLHDLPMVGESEMPAGPQGSKVADTVPRYVLGASDPELQRLVRQARTFAAAASWLLDQAGVTPGWRAVDVGCGPLGIMDLLCDRVGTTGETVGVDSEARMIAMARDIAAGLNLTNLTLVQADATATGLARASFDFAHARLLLVNLPDPQRVVAELAALVRPGGMVALHEADWVSWICQPPHPAWDRLRDAVRDFRARRGLDVHMGRRLPGLLRGAGLDVVGFRALCPAYIDGVGDQHTVLATFAKLHGAELVADELVTADELASLVAELEAHLADPATITIDKLYCQAWATRPAGT